jgi:hypothetical protein
MFEFGHLGSTHFGFVNPKICMCNDVLALIELPQLHCIPLRNAAV